MKHFWQRLKCRLGFHHQPEIQTEYVTRYLAHFRVTRCVKCRRAINWHNTDTGINYSSPDQYVYERYG